MEQAPEPAAGEKAIENDLPDHVNFTSTASTSPMHGLDKVWRVS